MAKFFYFLCVIFYILKGCSCWVSLGYDKYFYTVLSIFTCTIWIAAYRNGIAKIEKSFFFLLIGLCIVSFISSRLNIIGTIDVAIRTFAMCTPLYIIKSEQTKLLSRINAIFYILVTITIVFHVLKLFGFLPSVSTIQRGSYFYQNYFVYLYSPNYENKLCGFCYEPGFFSLLLSALLLINNYDLKKKETKIYLTGLILTMSLGGYLITVICWFIRYTFQKENKSIMFIRSFIFVSVILLLYFGVTNYWNNGNNIVNELVVEKFEDASSKGVRSRQNYEAEILWYHFLSSDSKLLGYGTEEYNKLKQQGKNDYDAASVVEYIMICGIVGTFIYICSLAIFVFYKQNILYSLPGYTLLVLDFIQHGFGVESSMFVLILLWVVYLSKRDLTYNRKKLISIT